MSTYADFQDEVMATIATATGTVLSDDASKQTLFTSVEAAALSLVSFMNDGIAGSRGRPAPPYAAVQIGEMVHDPEWGARSRTYRAPVTVAYINSCESGATQKTVHVVAEAVADAIDNDASFNTFQAPPERATIDSSEANPVFMTLAVQSKVDIVAAVVTWSPGLLIER